MPKKTLFITALLVIAAAAFGQSGKDVTGWFPKTLHAYAKDYVIRVPINGLVDTTVNTSRTVPFFVPESAELVRAWIMTPDSVITDTITNYYSYEIYSNNRATVDTAFTWTISAGHKFQHKTPRVEPMKPTAVVTKRYFSAGEYGYVVQKQNGTGTECPSYVSAILLLRPVSSPARADSNYSR